MDRVFQQTSEEALLKDDDGDKTDCFAVRRKMYMRATKRRLRRRNSTGAISWQPED